MLTLEAAAAGVSEMEHGDEIGPRFAYASSHSSISSKPRQWKLKIARIG